MLKVTDIKIGIKPNSIKPFNSGDKKLFVLEDMNEFTHGIFYNGKKFIRLFTHDKAGNLY